MLLQKDVQGDLLEGVRGRGELLEAVVEPDLR